MMGLAAPVAVVAHDAGAANIIQAWLQVEGIADCRPAMAGPAGRIWAENFPHAPLLTLEEALVGARSVLSGTGWASDFEHRARASARARGIPSVAVIDHWVNYRERFQRDGEEILPDLVWVTDSDALAEARRAIPEVAAIERPNLYLRSQAVAAGRRPTRGDLLFVAEPARSDWGQGIPGEFQTLDYLAAHRDTAGIDPDAPLRIRPHPSDPAGKYDAWIASHPGACLDESADMAEALRDASWVAGLQSTALVIALEAGRPAICALPPAAPPCSLPQSGLLHLRQLV